MITKFRLYESEQNMKWFYHATKPEYLPSIVKHGILPNTDRKVNWGHFEEWSRGKAFVTNWYAQAIFYGQIINHYNNKFYPILRVKINPDDLIKDEKSSCDFYSTKPIIGDFEIYDFVGKYYYDESWKKLTPELAKFLSNPENDINNLEDLVIEKRVERSDREELYRDDDFIVVRPLTHEASRKYGCDTNWCTSVERESFWEEHTKNGIVIYVINRHKKPKPLSERNQKIREFQKLYNEDEWDYLSKEEKIKKFLDFSRVAVSYSPDDYGFAIHDAHNFDLNNFDIYDINELPIPKNITKLIDDYIYKWRESVPELSMSEGMKNVSSGVVSWEELRETVPNSVYLKAKKMYANVEGKPNIVGDSDVVEGWWIETHTLGCLNSADESEENWVDSHWKIFDEYTKDGMSYVVPAEDFIFVTLTPQKNLIEEGLISSTPVKKTLKILKKKFPDYYIGLQTTDGDIQISAGRKEYVDDLHSIDNICRQIGWFISHGNIPSEGLYYKYNEPEFFDQKYEEVIIKPKFDEKDLPGKPSILYHVTPKRVVEKILRIGLVPKHKGKLTYHPDRVYLIDELELAYGLKKEFQRLDKIEYDILKINTKGLDIKLYADVDYPQHGFYTLENIPPKFISILPKEEYRKHWENNNKNQSY